MEKLPPSVLNEFYGLAAKGDQERYKSGWNIANFLYSSDCSEEAEKYIFDRLCKGITSNNGAARQGFATALYTLVQMRKNIDVIEIYNSVCTIAKVPRKAKASETKDSIITKFFAGAILLKVAQSEALITALFDLTSKRSWLEKCLLSVFYECLFSSPSDETDENLKVWGKCLKEYLAKYKVRKMKAPSETLFMLGLENPRQLILSLHCYPNDNNFSKTFEDIILEKDKTKVELFSAILQDEQNNKLKEEMIQALHGAINTFNLRDKATSASANCLNKILGINTPTPHNVSLNIIYATQIVKEITRLGDFSKLSSILEIYFSKKGPFQGVFTFDNGKSYFGLLDEFATSFVAMRKAEPVLVSELSKSFLEFNEHEVKNNLGGQLLRLLMRKIIDTNESLPDMLDFYMLTMPKKKKVDFVNFLAETLKPNIAFNLYKQIVGTKLLRKQRRINIVNFFETEAKIIRSKGLEGIEKIEYLQEIKSSIFEKNHLLTKVCTVLGINSLPDTFLEVQEGLKSLDFFIFRLCCYCTKQFVTEVTSESKITFFKEIVEDLVTIKEDLTKDSKNKESKLVFFDTLLALLAESPDLRPLINSTITIILLDSEKLFQDTIVDAILLVLSTIARNGQANSSEEINEETSDSEANDMAISDDELEMENESNDDSIASEDMMEIEESSESAKLEMDKLESVIKMIVTGKREEQKRKNSLAKFSNDFRMRCIKLLEIFQDNLDNNNLEGKITLFLGVLKLSFKMEKLSGSVTNKKVRDITKKLLPLAKSIVQTNVIGFPSSMKLIDDTLNIQLEFSTPNDGFKLVFDMLFALYDSSPNENFSKLAILALAKLMSCGIEVSNIPELFKEVEQHILAYFTKNKENYLPLLCQKLHLFPENYKILLLNLILTTMDNKSIREKKKYALKAYKLIAIIFAQIKLLESLEAKNTVKSEDVYENITKCIENVLKESQYGKLKKKSVKPAEVHTLLKYLVYLAEKNKAEPVAIFKGFLDRLNAGQTLSPKLLGTLNTLAQIVETKDAKQIVDIVAKLKRKKKDRKNEKRNKKRARLQ